MQRGVAGGTTRHFFGFKRLLGAIALAAAGLLSASDAQAQSKAATLVVDANTGQTLHESNADELRHPASLTKMMTLYLVFEAIERGRLSYTTRIKISQEAASAAPTKLDLEPGETIAVIDAVKALITKSANDISIALAEALAGTETRFAEVMTAKARQIGMTRTLFRNASGLPDGAQLTTARDMLTLALRLQDDFPKHYPLFAIRSFTYNGSTFKNHNTMLWGLDGVDGIKTGYTRMSGFNLVTSYRRGEKHLVAAVFGGMTAATRNAHMRYLLARTIMKASPVKTRRSAPVLIASPRLAPRPDARPPSQPAFAQSNATPWPKPVVQPAAKAPEPQPPRPAISTPVPEAAPKQLAAARAAEPVPAAAIQAPPIEITRVRPVMVAQRVKPPVQPPVASEPETVQPSQSAAMLPDTAPAFDDDEPATVAQPVAARPDPRLRTFAAPHISPSQGEPARLALAPSTQASEIATPAPAPAVPKPQASEAQPVSQQPQLAAPQAPPRPRAPATPLPAAPVAAATAPALPAAPQSATVAARGAQPSTLQQQAENLARGATPLPAAAQPSRPVLVARAEGAPAFRLRGPESQNSAAALPAAGAFQIQIGAYVTAEEAERALTQLRERAPDVVGKFAPQTVPVRKESRTLYRARYSGFDSKTAAATCLELRRRQIDCFVMRPE